MNGHDYWAEPIVGRTMRIKHGGYTWLMHDSGRPGRIMRTLRGGHAVEPSVLDDMKAMNVTGRAVDAGGGLGNHALWLAIGCGLKVETFEPRLARVIEANVRTNHLEGRVRVWNVALGAGPGHAHWSDKQRGHLETGDGDVAVRPLDWFGWSDVGLIKIDVEGMETDVLAGGRETIGRCRPIIYAEAWDEEYLEAIRAILEPLGYTYGRRFKWHQHRWMP